MCSQFFSNSQRPPAPISIPIPIPAHPIRNRMTTITITVLMPGSQRWENLGSYEDMYLFLQSIWVES